MTGQVTIWWFLSEKKNRDIIGLKPSVCVRVVPDPRAELQVDPARGPQGLGRPGALLKVDSLGHKNKKLLE